MHRPFKYIYPVFIMLVLCLLSSCASQKDVGRYKNYRTAHVKKASITIEMDGSRINTSGQMQTVNDSIVIISIRPFAGMEVAQVRAGKDSLTVIDRMQRRYATAAYKDISKYTKPSLKYGELQALAAAENIRNGELSAVETIDFAGHKIVVTIVYPAVVYDEDMRLCPERTSGYVCIDAVSMLEQLAAGLQLKQ